MLGNYDEEIKNEKRYLTLVVAAINNFIKLNSNGKNQKLIEKQGKRFDNIRVDLAKNKLKLSKYVEKIKSDFKKVNIYTYEDDKVLDALRNDTRDFSYNEVNKIKAIFNKNRELDDVLIALYREYVDTERRIENLKIQKENASKREAERQRKMAEERAERNKPKLTDEQIINKRRKEEYERQEIKSNENASRLLEGPKFSLGALLKGKDLMVNDMTYLYGLAMDVLYVMNIDQTVKISRPKFGEDARFYNAYLDTSYNTNMKVECILKSYDVSSAQELLNKYEKIREMYYKKYSKLSSDKKELYNIERLESYKIEDSIGEHTVPLFHSLKNEKFSFPPSKDKMIELMNRRIMNGSSFNRCHPKEDENITSEPENYQKYSEVKEYYKNLTKNMDEKQIKDFYHAVINDLREGLSYGDLKPNVEQSYYALMQKLFCELIFDRKDMKYSDTKQYSEVLEKIAKEVFEEELKIVKSTGEVTEELTEKRKNTIEAEYIKYRVKLNMEGKDKPLSFRDFASQKYNLQNILESDNLEDLIKEEIKGMKK